MSELKEDFQEARNKLISKLAPNGELIDSEILLLIGQMNEAFLKADKCVSSCPMRERDNEAVKNRCKLGIKN
jgi:hypothetical protein